MWIRIRAVHDSGSALDSMRIWILDVENLLKTGIFFISTVNGYDTYITVQYSIVADQLSVYLFDKKKLKIKSLRFKFLF